MLPLETKATVTLTLSLFRVATGAEPKTAQSQQELPSNCPALALRLWSTLVNFLTLAAKREPCRRVTEEALP